MEMYATIIKLRSVLATAKKQGAMLALVPTMGNLHEGHFSLVRKARAECDFVVTSLFINPTQFGPDEDLARYPRSFDEDKTALEALECDVLFAPSIEEIYPDGSELSTIVSVPELAGLHCGASRPGHFDGVCTMVSKLFNICQPDRVYFGEKDYQQLTIIKKMVTDLNLGLEVVSVPTVREACGLAMSSRNNYLDEKQKQQAAVLYKTLASCAAAIKAGRSDFAVLEQDASQEITRGGLHPDYFSICEAHTLRPAQADTKELVILAAAYLGNTRLIDNISLCPA